MSHTPTTSIILPSYNYGWCLEDAIESVLAQNTNDWELLIVDDGSRDNAPTIAAEYAKRYDAISLHTHADGGNHGLPATYRLGRHLARGDYLAFLEGDDCWHPSALSVKQQIFDAAPDVVCVYTDVTMFGDTQTIHRTRYAFRDLIDGVDIYEQAFCAFPYLMNQNRVPSFSATMVRRDAFAQIALPDDTQVWLDWLVWAQLSLYGWFYFIPAAYTWWRRHEASYNQQYSDSLAASGELEMAHLSMQQRIRAYAQDRLPDLRRTDIALALAVEDTLRYY